VVPPSSLSAVHDAVVPAYAEGIASTGFATTEDEVCRGHVVTMSPAAACPPSSRSMRSPFGAEPSVYHLAERKAMTRRLLDLQATLCATRRPTLVSLHLQPVKAPISDVSPTTVDAEGVADDNGLWRGASKLAAGDSSQVKRS
jgi:hypothetical protein